MMDKKEMFERQKQKQRCWSKTVCGGRNSNSKTADETSNQLDDENGGWRASAKNWK